MDFACALLMPAEQSWPFVVMTRTPLRFCSFFTLTASTLSGGEVITGVTSVSLLPTFTLLLLFGAVFALLALRAALSDLAGCSGLAIFMALEPAEPLAGRLEDILTLF